MKTRGGASVRTIRLIIWAIVGLTGAYGLALIAFARGEQRPSVLWFIVAALCIYAIGYRFYSKFIAERVLELDDAQPTPAVRLANGRDYMPTPRWITFGHHFAAIAGPGPLVGPVLAAQFGYLPSTLWIVIGAGLGGCVQDFVILGYSLKRDGRSLGRMAREEIGPVGGATALAGVMLIMVILIAVLGLVVVNAMKHSVWATSTVAATVPIAMFVGLYMTWLRPDDVAAAWPLGRGLGDRRHLDSVGGRRRPLRHGTRLRPVVRSRRPAPRGLDYRLRLSRLGVADLAVAGAARLPFGFHQDRHHHRARRRHRRAPSAHPDAPVDALYRRQRSGLRRQGLPVRLHHRGLRRNLGLSCA
jgi:hypothetical protein